MDYRFPLCCATGYSYESDYVYTPALLDILLGLLITITLTPNALNVFYPFYDAFVFDRLIYDQFCLPFFFFLCVENFCDITYVIGTGSV